MDAKRSANECFGPLFWWQLAGLLATFLLFSGCMSVLPRNSVPPHLAKQATVPGMPNVRYWGGLEDVHYRESLRSMIATRMAIEKVSNLNELDEMPILVLSGGGPHGAFGSGILNGWTENGTRPEFALVTGVSTGALIAPFAFLGSEYDDELANIFTTLRTENILERLSILKIFYGDSISSTFPLWHLIESEFTDGMLEAIAQEHNRGRRLLVSSTNLDAQIGVIWDLGAIASSGHPEALNVFRKALLASASIPVAFPPVYFDVISGGDIFEEMHVDGGLAHQLFLFGGVLSKALWNESAEGDEIHPDMPIYVIKNGYLTGQYSEVDRRLMPIFMKTIGSLTTSQGVGDIRRVYTYSQDLHSEFNFIHVPNAVVDESTEPFDQREMARLFQIGYDIAKDKDFWKHVPPDH